MGQVALNDTLKDKLKDMKDFTFSFRGDDVFSPNRVKILEQTVQKQASGDYEKKSVNSFTTRYSMIIIKARGGCFCFQPYLHY